MLPIELIVVGTPISHQTRNRKRLRVWQQSVRDAAEIIWPTGRPPIAAQLKIIVVYYHDGTYVRIDNDNLIKPIQDALNGLIYADDAQITDTTIRKTDINGRFRVRGMSPVLARGFIQGEEFIYIHIQLAPDHEDLLP